MTPEEKAKRYDKAIETARKIISGEGVVAPSDWTIPEVIFPELRESDDDKIRKEIIQYIKTGTYHKDWIAWLEKQSNQKVTIDFKAEDWYVSKVDDKIHNIYGSDKSALEAINEENVDNANKIEQKTFLQKCFNAEYERGKNDAVTWSEEDEKCTRLSTDIIDSALRAGFCVQLDRDRCIDWIKSLKDRVQPKQELNENS